MKKTTIILLLSFIGYGAVQAQTSYNLSYNTITAGKDTASIFNAKGHLQIRGVDVQTSLNSKTNQSNVLVFAGNSITEGVTAGGTPLASLTFPAKPFTKYTTAVYGNTSLQQLNAAPADVDPKFDYRGVNIVAYLCGINDLSTFSAPVDTVTKRLRLYWQGRKANGWKVIASTLIDCQYGTDANRVAVNTWIRANWATYADALADYAANSVFNVHGVYANTTYYIDGVHPTPAGTTIMASILKPKVDSLANLSGNNTLYAPIVNATNELDVRPNPLPSDSASVIFNGGAMKVTSYTDANGDPNGGSISQFYNDTQYRKEIAWDVNGVINIRTLTSGLVKSTSGNLSIATAGTDYESPLTFSGNLSRSVNAISFSANPSFTTVAATDGFINRSYFGGGGYRALYPSNLTPGNTNYTLLSNGSTAVLNASTLTTIAIGGNNILDATATGVKVYGSISVANNSIAGQFTITAANNITVTTSSVSTGDLIFFQEVDGTAGNAPKPINGYTISNGVSFTANTQGVGTGTYNWFIIKKY